jgi:hypothetical protein
MEEAAPRTGRRTWARELGVPLCVLAAFGLGCLSYPSGSSVRVQRETKTGERTLEDKLAQGPPPHAPAHGRRRNATVREIDMVYRSELGVFVVLDYEDHYHDGERYLRWNAGVWETNAEFRGRWAPLAEAELPPGLRKKYAGNGKGKGKGRPDELPARPQD